MLELKARLHRLWRHRRRARHRPRRSATARSWRWSAPTAPANRRWSRPSPACCRSRAGEILLEGERIDRSSPRARVLRGHRPCARGPPGLRRPDRRGESAARRLCASRARSREAELEARIAEVVRALPGAARAARRAGGQSLRRPAADAGDRPRPDVGAAASVLDEPSLGLAPVLVAEIFRLIAGLRDAGPRDPAVRAERAADASPSPTAPMSSRRAASRLRARARSCSASPRSPSAISASARPSGRRRAAPRAARRAPQGDFRRVTGLTPPPAMSARRAAGRAAGRESGATPHP